ncbi:hypothetical protein IIQ44_03670 [Acinetobacter oleivorans]|uniref:Uncharacterized protein n=1 Tax=Acinetobacter oleivorans TaxID=1148157 RepID=A0ABR9NLQ8_9GAMM|nr:hypothetical protein [Acinetobacter oleivorans]MBE2165400.1 hypothetical protein [Acinetobacter oleivorans]MBE2171004.1 hypothetical protein [Acinetobacter oleivorans]
MKKYVTPFIIITMALTSACSNATDSAKNVEKASSEPVVKAISAEDQKIIDKYESYFKYYREGNFEEFQNKMKEVLPEVSKISDKNKREFMQMNIYMTLQDYDEALALNAKQIKEHPDNPALYISKCQILKIQEKDTHLITQCFDDAAFILKAQLDKPENKADPEYKQGEFTYLLAKYKGGHPEYKEKMQKYIADTKDENLKASFTTIYDVEVEN